MNKQLIIALVVCTGLAGLYFATRENEVRVGIPEQESARVETKNVSRVVFAGKEDFELVKDGERFVVKNGQARTVLASNEAVKELFDAVAVLQPGIFVTEQKSKQAEFKVDDSSGQRVTLFAGDKQIWSMIIGDYAEEGGRYVRTPGQDAIYLMRARFWDITRNNMNDFREHRIVDISEADIESVHVERGRKREALSAESKAIVANLRAAGFVESADTLQRLEKLFKKRGERVVVTAKGSELALNIVSDEKVKKAYAQVEGKPDVYEISEYVYAQLRGVRF